MKGDPRKEVSLCADDVSNKMVGAIGFEPMTSTV
jgi:hypothetical protein